MPAVVEARTLIQKRTIQALNKAVEFNEVLRSVLALNTLLSNKSPCQLCVYGEAENGCKFVYRLLRRGLIVIQFHSDAEVGLGPLVAGLSLGSPALMHFRLHARHDPLYERRGILLTVVLRHVSSLGYSTISDCSLQSSRVTFLSWTVPRSRNITSGC